MSEYCYTSGGYAYAEVDSDYSATFTNDQPGGAKRKLRCPWSVHVNLANYLLTANNTTVGGIPIRVGAVHPNYSTLFVNSVNVTALGNPTGALAAWTDAILEVNYKSLQFDPLVPTIVREDAVGLSTEIVPVERATSKFVSNNKKPVIDPDFVITYLHYRVTLRGITTVPLASVISCLNKLSSTSMTFKVGTSSTTTIAAGQVLYQGIDDIKVAYTTTGVQSFDVTHSFLISPFNLNYEFNPNSTATTFYGKYEAVTPAKYGTENFSVLGV